MKAMIVALAGLLAAAPALAADTTLAVDVEAALDHSGDAGDRQVGSELGALGHGFAARLGRAYEVPLLHITPEVGGSVHSFDGDDRYRLFAGARVGVGAVLMPSIYGHVGYQFGADQMAAGFAPDVGVALDLRPIPVLSAGVHLQHTFDSRGTTAAGGHLTLTF